MKGGTTMTEVETCDRVLFAQTYFEQAEYCENDKVDGTDYCAEHQGWWDDDPRYDTVKEWLGEA
jgi:hypothetical protein